MGNLVRALGVLVGAVLVAPSGAAAALSLAPVGSFDQPMYVTSEPGDASRLFVVERPGRIQLKDGSATPVEFLDIATQVSTSGERGLLSMAFPPDYATSGLFYVFYTTLDGDLRISEFSASGDDASEASEREVMTIEHSSQSNHNGGQLQFGPDGMLYASTGDGGGSGDPDENAENTNSLLGKILRIDPAGDSPGEYTIPPGNPFAGATPGADEVWSYGLRNPWRFSFDRATGALTIGDVGQAAWEEIDWDPVARGAGRGDNFGWDVCEGLHGFEGSDALCAGTTFTRPVFEYLNPPEPGAGAAITGGYVVRDPSLGDLYGRYVYADLFVGDIRSLCPTLPSATGDRSEGLPSVASPSSFGEDALGRVYVASLGANTVSRISGSAEPGACPSSPPPPPPPPPPGGESDTDAPNLDLDARRRHDVGDSRVLKVTATVDEPAEVELRAKAGLGGEPLKLGQASAAVGAGAPEKLRWKLTRREARSIRRRLRDGRRSKARIGGHATDAAGNASERESLKIRLGR